jgi:hypothetical protein
MYEKRHEPLLPPRLFYRRIARNASYGLALVVFSLAIGMAGYRLFEGLAWIDAFLNAAMILSGMGPVDILRHSSAKVFAGCYAIFSGIALISTAAIVFAPVVHRVIHKFHLAEGKD